jgi:hypothetical protein
MHHLHYGKSKKPLASVRPDEVYPTMWRIHWPDGSVSDMVNLARAKDAAQAIAERGPPPHPPRNRRRFHWEQERSKTASEARHSDFGGVPATPVSTARKNEISVVSGLDYGDGYWGV